MGAGGGGRPVNPKRVAIFGHEAAITITKGGLAPLDAPDTPMRREGEEREGEEGSPRLEAAKEEAIWRVLEAQRPEGCCGLAEGVQGKPPR
jgi:hypothetical protein